MLQSLAARRQYPREGVVLTRFGSILQMHTSRRGGGLWSFIKGVGRRVLPFLKQYILPGLYNVGTSVASDVSQGNTSLRDSLKRRGLEEVERAVGRAARGGSALSKKRGRITKAKARKKRRRNESVDIYNDVFRH